MLLAEFHDALFESACSLFKLVPFLEFAILFDPALFVFNEDETGSADAFLLPLLLTLVSNPRLTEFEGICALLRDSQVPEMSFGICVIAHYRLTAYFGIAKDVAVMDLVHVLQELIISDVEDPMVP